MKPKTLLFKHIINFIFMGILLILSINLQAQTLAFPEASGFGRYSTGARGHANPQIYLVTNLNDSGPGSFRDAVSEAGRFVIFKVGGIINLESQIVVAENTTIAGQTAPGEGIVLFGPRVTFTGASNTISRYISIRHGTTSKNKDASGLSNGQNMIFDHMGFTWGTDEVFSINWDNKGLSPDNITVQNSIIGQGLHRHNHSAGGLIQTPDGKVSLIGNLYISNKTRNPKVKGFNEFVNNVVYNWGNYGNTYEHTESGEAYIMGGDSEGISNVNIINNYFIGGPYSGPSRTTPFSRGNSNFFFYGSGNYFDNNKNGMLDGTLVPGDLAGYPTGDAATIQTTPYDYPMNTPSLSAQQAYEEVVSNVGASYPKRDQVDSLLLADLMSKGTEAFYVYRQSDLPFINGGAGHVYGAPAPLDTDNDGMPDVWEDDKGLDKNDAADALSVSTSDSPYLNIEVYINGLINETPPDFIIPPANLNFTDAASTETPPSSSFTINWNDNADNEDNYIIERSTDGENFTVVETLAANSTSYDETGLDPGTTYYYRIKATNATESSVYSEVAPFTTPSIPSPPTKAEEPNPTNGFGYVNLTNGTLTLQWTGSSDTENFEVFFGEDETDLTKRADVSYSENPSYEIEDLTSGTDYYWRIDASNNKGNTTGDLWDFSTIANITEGLVGYWAFDEAALEGTQITDSTDYENHGILDSDYDNANVRVEGKINNALDFSTSPDNTYMASIPSQDQLYLNERSFTISLWMKADPSLLPSGSNSSYLLCKGSFTADALSGATGKRYDIEFKDSQLRFAIDDNSTKKELSTDGSPFFTGDWEHVVVMRDIDAHKLKLYLDGVLIDELDETGVNNIAEPTDLVLGNIGVLELMAGTNPAPYKGQLDELKIFNYALSTTEVESLYQNILGTEKISYGTKEISVYPNPTHQLVNIAIPAYKHSYATATVRGLTGKMIYKERIESNGNGLFHLNIKKKLSAGVYILNVTGENLNNKLRIIVK